MASYSFELVRALIDTQVTSLNDAIDWINHLERSTVALQQKVDQQASELEHQSRNLNTMLAEAQRVQRQLVQMEKMAMLGQMVAGISHEINNPINSIYGNLPFIEEHVRDLLHVLQAYQVSCSSGQAAVQTALGEVELDYVLEDLPRILGSMKVGADRIRELVLTMRNFYRLDEEAMKPADLHEGIENTLLLLQHRYKYDIQIVKEFGEIPLVECHVNQINQVFMNLLSNAIDALLEPKDAAQQVASDANRQAPETKEITIKTYLLSPGWVAISIGDIGPGVPLEIQGRLFEAFFTTKPMGIGTGLGLSISHQIITEAHHGHIYCCSAPNGGTTFMVELPVKQLQESIGEVDHS